MKLVQYYSGGFDRLGAVVGTDTIADLTSMLANVLLPRQWLHGESASRLAQLLAPPRLSDFLALRQTAVAAAQDVITYVYAADENELQEYRIAGWLMSSSEIQFAPPLAPGASFYCVGRNYPGHIAETGSAAPDLPAVFMRNLASLVGHRQPLVRPSVSSQHDWEGELAVVIGQACHRVTRERALDYVGGYTIFNDGSIRDFQQRSAFMTAGKNFHHSGSMGPWVATSDEIDDPRDVEIVTQVNGELMQRSMSSAMIFDIATLIAFISEFAILQPGDIVATGTPSGVGYKMSPPRYLTPGDELVVEIRGIGSLENTVVQEET